MIILHFMIIITRFLSDVLHVVIGMEYTGLL